MVCKVWALLPIARMEISAMTQEREHRYTVVGRTSSCRSEYAEKCDPLGEMSINRMPETESVPNSDHSFRWRAITCHSDPI